MERLAGPFVPQGKLSPAPTEILTRTPDRDRGATGDGLAFSGAGLWAE